MLFVCDNTQTKEQLVSAVDLFINRFKLLKLIRLIFLIWFTASCLYNANNCTNRL